MQKLLLLAIGLPALLATVSAHPGHDIEAEALERRDFISRNTHLHARCGAQLAADGIGGRALRRRHKLAQGFRNNRGLTQWPMLRSRDLSEVLGKDHHSNLTGVDFSTDADTLFGDKSSCLLQPEATEGPYYITGEMIRNNMTESQEGVPLMIDMQVIDTNTCQPYQHHYVEFWHCNATGVYGGVVASGNGDSNDASNINATFLRGIQPTDDEGVVQMETIFPGHYTGRTPHIHILIHGKGTVLANKTLSGSSNTHVGQLFFDQELISTVEKINPYNKNTQSLTKNSEDGILAGEARSTDPMVEYVYAGASAADGIVAWITVGVNGSLSKSVSAAGSYGADGGHANSGSSGGDGGGSGASASSESSTAPGDGTSTTTSATMASASTSGTSNGVSTPGASTTSSHASPQERVSFAKVAIGCLLGLLV